MAGRDPLAQVEAAAERMATAVDVWRAAVLAAYTAGESLRAIADAAGVSHTTVRNVVQGR